MLPGMDAPANRSLSGPCDCDGCATRTGCGKARSRTNKERGIQPGRSKHVCYLHVPRFKQFLADRKVTWTSFEDVAEYLEVGTGTAYNAMTGGRLGGPFIGALSSKMRGSRYLLQDFLSPVPVVKEEPVAA